MRHLDIATVGALKTALRQLADSTPLAVMVDGTPMERATIAIAPFATAVAIDLTTLPEEPSPEETAAALNDELAPHPVPAEDSPEDGA